MEAERPLFYYDLGSPYAWLAAERIDEVLPVPPTWCPILLGGVFKAVGRGSWALTELREEGVAEVERRARAYRLPAVRWPEPWPGNTLHAMRAATHAERAGFGREFALAAFRLAYLEGVDLSDPEAALDAAARAGADPEETAAAIGRQDVKDELRAATEAAVERGVIGVPTVAAGDRLFWGDDRLEEAAAALVSSPG
jgi:2-hydroxychromene-2-carboxylate isomerase